MNRGTSIIFGSGNVTSGGRTGGGRAGGGCAGGVTTVEVVRSGMPCGCRGVNRRSVNRGASIKFSSGVMAGVRWSRLPLGRLPR